MPTEFSPTLLDNDPKFEYEPNKLIDVDSPKWFEWLESHHSFRFNAGNGGENSYRARKELNKSQGVYYWYGVKKVDNKLHKKYIGKTNEVTHRRLIEVAEVIRQPSGKQPKDIDIQPGNTPQITPQFEDRLNALETLVKQLQDGTAAKKYDSPVVASQELTIELDKLSTTNTELTNLLDNRDKQLQTLTNELDIAKIEAKAAKNDATLLNQEVQRLTSELDSRNSKLSELTNELTNKDSQLQELTNQVDNLNSKLSELTNELTNKDRELQDLKAAIPPVAAVPSPQLPITNDELPGEDVDSHLDPSPSPQSQEDNSIILNEKKSPNLDKPTIMLHDGSILAVSEKQEKVLNLLGLIPQTHNLLTSQFLGNICKDNLATNKGELESLIGEKIDSKGSTIRKTTAVLRSAGFVMSGGETKGFKIIGVK
jgi:uncharacterized phage infection (PIP) family protein YhgE